MRKFHGSFRSERVDFSKGVRLVTRTLGLCPVLDGWRECEIMKEFHLVQLGWQRVAN